MSSPSNRKTEKPRIRKERAQHTLLLVIRKRAPYITEEINADLPFVQNTGYLLEQLTVMKESFFLNHHGIQRNVPKGLIW